MESRNADETEILVVDDEPRVCDFLVRALSKRGFVCRTAGDAEAAIGEVSLRSPSLVITDLVMPGRDGRWLLGEIKRRWPELPVIVLTGDGEARTAVQCLKEGADDYLVKPVNLEELGIASRRAVDNAQLLCETREQRVHLDAVRRRSAELQQAFEVIETTYRDAIGALTRAESLERSAVGAGDAGEDRGPTSLLVDASPIAPSDSMQGSLAIELSGIRVAGRLIADGAPFRDVASAIANELVERDRLTRVCIWTHSGDSDELQPLVDVGNGSPPQREHAVRAFGSGTIDCRDSDEETSLSCPILANGAVRAVLQLVAPKAMGSNLRQSAERLTLLLAASLAREHDAEERRRTSDELELLYGLASASRYSLDLEHVAEFLLESLDKVIDYDVVSLLLVDEDPTLNIQTRFPADEDFVRRVREHVLANLELTCGIKPPKELAMRVKSVDSARSRPAPAKLRSFINVPLAVGDRVAGLIYVSSGRDRAFTDGEIQFVHRVANFLATSVQGVRELVSTVKGRIEQMVDHMTDGVLMLDRRGSVVAMNDAARQALSGRVEGGKPMNAARLAKILDFDPLDVLKSKRESFRKVVVVRGVPFQAQLSPVVSDNGDTVGAVLALRNFQQEQKLDEMKTELVNVVSHELRTPLTAIKNALSLLDSARLGTLNEKQHHFVELARRNVEQLVSIINDLLDLSKLEGGKMRIDLEPLSLGETVAAASSSLEAQAETKGLSMHSTIEADLPDVRGDAASIQRVLVNLIGNAIKFTEPGGAISIEAGRVAGESSCASGAAVRVSVVDSGVGVPKDQLECIFDKFHQVAGANRHTTTLGTGLGLPICRELIRAHHGRIWAENGDVSGSRFSFTLPVLADHELLSRCLDADIARARDEGTSIAVTLLSVRRESGSGVEIGSEPVSRLLDALKDVAKRVTRRSADRVFAIGDKAQIVVTLPRTAGDDGTVFTERLAAELQTSSIPIDGFSIVAGSSSYPDDGDTAEALYSQAEEVIRELALT